ncbi:hypothetical protein M1E08_15660 [Erwinia sp. PK3-005]
MLIESGSQIAMYQYVNDEILHYVWRDAILLCFQIDVAAKATRARQIGGQ